MSKVPTMNADTLLAYLKLSDQETFGRDELASRFKVSGTTIGKYMRALIGRGLVDVTIANHKNEYVLAGVKPQEISVVTAFRRDIWKAPLTGYAARLSAAADLAMAGRA